MARDCKSCNDSDCPTRDKPCITCEFIGNPCDGSGCQECGDLFALKRADGTREYLCNKDKCDKIENIDRCKSCFFQHWDRSKDPCSGCDGNTEWKEQTDCQTCKHGERCLKCSDGDSQWEPVEDRVVIDGAKIDAHTVAAENIAAVNDPVNNPSHYAHSKVQAWDFASYQKMGYLRGCAIKYISRAPHKDNTIQDIDKAIAYLQRYKRQVEETGVLD